MKKDKQEQEDKEAEEKAALETRNLEEVAGGGTVMFNPQPEPPDPKDLSQWTNTPLGGTR